MRVLILSLLLTLSVGIQAQTLLLFGEEVETPEGEIVRMPQTYMLNFDSQVLEQRVLMGNGEVVTCFIVQATERVDGRYLVITVDYVDMDAVADKMKIVLDTESRRFGVRIGDFYLQGSYVLD